MTQKPKVSLRSPSPLLVLVCGSAALAISYGVRSSFGLFLPPVSAEMGWSIGTLSLALATQNLIWGLTQPFAGAIADTRGTATLVVGGSLIYVGGLVLMALSGSELLFSVGAGVLVGFGLSAIGFPIVLGVVGRHAPDDRRSLFLGIATAGGSFGQFVFAPIGQVLLSHLGWTDALLAMGAVCFAMAALALGLPNRSHERKNSLPALRVGAPRLSETLVAAMGHPGFLLLNAGFFVCGFQIAFIVVHLPIFTSLCGLTPRSGALGIALIGAFNILGTLVAGYLGGVYRPKFPLSAIYLLRSTATVVLVTVTVTETIIVVFSMAMGLLWLSTVPLTSGVITQIFGPRYVATLFGIVFLSHQIGSFIGIWLGGYLYDLVGSYDAVWWISIALGVFAALVHLPIRDRPIALRATA